MVTDPYATLGVSKNASPEEIKKAYRTLAKQYHPDLHPNDARAAEKMNDINQAYDMINNPEKYRQNTYRQSYGQSSYSGNGSENAAGQQNGQYNPYGNQDPWVMFDDLFRELNRQSGQQNYNRQNAEQDDYRQYDRRTYRRGGGILFGIIRFFIIMMIIRFLLGGCSAAFIPYYYYSPGRQYEYQQPDMDEKGVLNGKEIGDV